MAPVDGEAGGTWLAVNEFGLTLALLNFHFRDGGRDVIGTHSRGLVPVELISAPTVGAVREKLRRYDLARFRPFTLVAVDPGGGAMAFRWNGRTLAILDSVQNLLPFTSSSFATESVESFRRKLFEKNVGFAAPPSAEALLAFHRDHTGGPGPFSPCMHRHDARTVSFCAVDVGEAVIRFSFFPDSPCRLGDSVEEVAENPTIVRLELARAASAVAGLTVGW